ncbi:MAG: class I SAM-dependent methyltransferase, partial [Acidobacteriota bacterium]|nr:class I SAM-dependent methyltransferase [Acidobacteriota bacterium]
MRLYSELAEWWPLLDDPADYAEEAGVYGDLLADACDAPIESLLELGSGGGNSASHLKRRFPRLVLADLSEDMLAVSRTLNPECEHRLGDMRTLRLGRTFDAVFVHDAVCYMTTEADLWRAMETAWVHCRPGGAVLFAPDYVRENFRAGETAGGCDERPRSGAAGACPRGLRYLEWVWDPDPKDTEYLVDFAFLLRERDGSVRAVQDRHVEGLFARGRWLDLLA